MKKSFLKTMAAFFIAAISLSGCIDTEVSPEVKQLREAQVAYLQAKIRLQEAMAEAQEISNAFEAAMNEIMLAEAQGELQVRLANIEVELVQAQIELRQRELELEQAIDAYEDWIEREGIEDAEQYLAEYTTAVNLLNTKIGQRLQKEAELAKAQLILASADAPWELNKLALERDLAQLGNQLTLQQEALANLEAVADDPATITTKLAEVNSEIFELENQIDQLFVEQEEALTEFFTKQAIFNNAENVITDYENLKSDLPGVQQDIISQQAIITVAQQNVQDAQADLAFAIAELAAANTIVLNSQAALSTWTAAYNTAKADKDAKQNAFDIAVQNEIIAQNNYNADPTAANQTALNNATTAKNNAQTALNTAITTLNDATADKTAAQNQLDNAQGVYDVKLFNKNNAEDNLFTAQTALTDAQHELEDLNAEKTALETQIANLQATYDDAMANRETYETDLYIAMNNWFAVNDQFFDVATEIDILTNLRDSYEFIIENGMITSEIAGLKADIEQTRADIFATTTALEDEKIDEAAQSDLVNKLAAEVTLLNDEITALQAKVERLKQLLDAAIG